MTDDSIETPQQTRSLWLLLLVAGLLIAVAYGQVLLAHSRERWIAPLRDDLIFFQYARSLADGHPYRFFPTAERTTGATSHLYVFALAAMYKAGLTGDRLAAGAFVFNALLWLATLMLVYASARRLFPQVAFAATLLVALTGPVGFAFFAGHDMGLATALFFLALYGLASERPILVAAPALFLLGWARPEGLLIAPALVAVALVAPAEKRKPAWAIAGAIGLVGSATMLLWNQYLTGEFAFTSMKGKGVLGVYPFHVVLAELSRSLTAVVREIFLGWSDGARGFYFIPLIAIPVLFGFLPRCRPATVEAWLATSAAAVILLISASGFAGVQHDKYLVWILALVAIYAVAGLPRIEQALGGRVGWRALCVLCVIYGAVGTAWFLGDYGRRVVEERAMAGVANQARGRLPTATRIGVVAGSGIQYYFPEREVINISGVTHRAFGAAWGNTAAQVEVLEDQPNLQPDVWFLGEAARGPLADVGLVGPPLFSTPAFLGADAHESFYAAQCKGLGIGEKPLAAGLASVLKGKDLIDEIDLGSPEQEAAHDYRRFTRAAGTRLLGNVVRRRFEGKEIVEAGYVILGDEEFRVAVRPNKDVWVVVRTARQMSAFSLLGPRHRERFDLALQPPVRVHVYANGQPVSLSLDQFTPANADLDERLLHIPAAAVTGSSLHIRIADDHIAFHYWFYQ